MKPKDRIIVAADVSTVDELVDLVMTLAPHVGYFKVGLELIMPIIDKFFIVYSSNNNFGGSCFYVRSG